MNGGHVHTILVCISLQWAGGLHVVRLLAGSWHGLLHWSHGLCMECVVSCSSTSFPWHVFFFAALLWRSIFYKHTVRWMWQGSASVVSRNWEKCFCPSKLFQSCQCCCCLCYPGMYLRLGTLVSYNWAQVLEAFHYLWKSPGGYSWTASVAPTGPSSYTGKEIGQDGVMLSFALLKITYILRNCNFLFPGSSLHPWHCGDYSIWVYWVPSRNAVPGSDGCWRDIHCKICWHQTADSKEVNLPWIAGRIWTTGFVEIIKHALTARRWTCFELLEE